MALNVYQTYMERCIDKLSVFKLCESNREDEPTNMSGMDVDTIPCGSLAL